MKLSEMSTQKAAQCMVELAAPMNAILKNPAVKEYMKKSANKEATVSMMLDAFAELIPVFLRDHYNEMVKIVSILSCKTAEEVSNQSIIDTLKDLKGSVDREFIDFFTR